MKKLLFFVIPLNLVTFAQSMNCNDPNNVCINSMFNFGMALYGCATGSSVSLAFNVPPGQDWQFSVYTGDPSRQSFAILTEDASNNMPGGVCDGGPGVLFGPVSIDADTNPTPTVFTIPSSQVDVIRAAIANDGFVVIEASDCSSFIEFAGITLTRNAASSNVDLAIFSVQAPAIVARNDSVSLDFEIVNQGSNAVDSVMVSLPVPCHCIFEAGDVSGMPLVESNGILTCSVGTLGVGTVLQGSLQLHADALGLIGFDLAVSGLGCEATSQDNHLMGSFQVVPAEGDFCSCGFGFLGAGFSTEIRGLRHPTINKQGGDHQISSFRSTGSTGIQMCETPFEFSVTDEDFRDYYTDSAPMKTEGWFFDCSTSPHQAQITVTKDMAPAFFFERTLVMKPMGIFNQEQLVVHDLAIDPEPHWLEAMNQLSDFSSITIEIRSEDGTLQSTETIQLIPWDIKKIDLNDHLPMGGPWVAWMTGGPGAHLVYHHELIQGVEILLGSEPVSGPFLLPMYGPGQIQYQRHPLDFISSSLSLDLTSQALCTNEALSTLNQEAAGQTQFREAVTVDLNLPGLSFLNPLESEGTSGFMWYLNGQQFFIPPMQPQTSFLFFNPPAQDPSKTSVSFFSDEPKTLKYALVDRDGKVLKISDRDILPGATSFCNVFNSNQEAYAVWQPIHGNQKGSSSLFATAMVVDEINQTYDVIAPLEQASSVLDSFYDGVSSWHAGTQNCFGRPTDLLDLIRFFTESQPCP